MGLSGLEPPTSPLSGVRSNQLSYRPVNFTKRVTRIELATTAWKAVVLPLNYTRKINGPDGIWTRDLLRDRQACYPLHHGTILKKLRGQDLNLRPSGYEPDELPTAPPRDNINR